jgi:uncharacterized protein YkvS
MGKLFSMHSVTAVLSITDRRRFKKVQVGQVIEFF